MQLTKGAIGNLINRYKAVLKKCHLLNVFGSLAVAGMLIMGGAGVAVAEGSWTKPNGETAQWTNGVVPNGTVLQGTYKGFSQAEGTLAGVATVDYTTTGVSVANGTIFTNNSKTTGAAGALKLLNGITIGDNVKFENNKAESPAWGGGALYIKLVKPSSSTTQATPSAVQEVTIGAKAVFTGNEASSLGGAIALEYGQLTIEKRARFENNEAATGGAIAMWHDASTNGETSGSLLNISNAAFIGNKATIDGGALSLADTAGGKVTLVGNSFTSNTAQRYGGAIFTDGILSVKNTTFDNNIAGVVGGAIASTTTQTASMTISGSTFTNNHSVYDGGAIGNYSGMIITNSTFENNTAQLNMAEDGTWTESVEDSTAVGGGAISLGAVSSSAVASISNTTFKNNISGTHGGAIATRMGKDADNSAAKLDIAATFIGNKAQQGGAIYNTFYTNNGLGKGDGVTVAGDFQQNTASDKGGAIFNDGARDKSDANGGIMTVSNSNFDGNTAMAGGAIYNTGTLTFTGTNTFTNNTAADNPNDIYNAGTITVAGGTTTLNSGLILAENGTVKVTGGTLDMASGSTLDMGDGTLTIAGGTFVADAGLLIKNVATDGSYAANDANKVTDSSIVGTEGNLNLRWFDGTYTADEYASVKQALMNSGSENATLNLLNATLELGAGQDLVVGASPNGNEVTITMAPVVVVGTQTPGEAAVANKEIESVQNQIVSVVAADDGRESKQLLAANTITVSDSKFTAKGLEIAGTAGTGAVTLQVINNSDITLTGEGGGFTGVVAEGEAVATAVTVNGATLNMGLTGNTQDQGLTLVGATVETGGTLNANGGATGTTSEYAINALTMQDNSKVNVLNSTMQIGEFTATGGTMFVDPAYVKIDSVASSTFGTQLLVGSGSTVNIGGMPEADMRQAMEKAGMSVGPNFTVGANQSVLVLGQALTLGAGGKIVVDADVTDTGTIPGTSPVATAHFGKDSLLVVNGTNINGTAALTLSAPSTEFTVQNGAKLLISGAQNGKTYTVIANGNGTSAFNGSGYSDSTADGWKGSNLLTSSDMVTLTSADGMTFTAGVEDAKNVFPNLSEGMTNAVNKLYRDSLNNVDSDQMGVRFLSRATDNRFLGADKNAAAATIESAARIAFAGAVPQMTKMASDAGTNAVVNRLGFADPADGAQAMDAEGKIVDRNTTGFALWIAPLWQSQHGWGMDADSMDYGFNGNLGGVSLGADYTFENAIRAGITFNIGGGYAESSGGDLSSTDNRMNFWGLGAYAGWNYENFGVMADVSYTSTWNDLKQDVDSRMGMGDLEADVQATAISAGLRAEYLLQTSAMDIIPHIGVRYMSLNTWGYDVDTHGGTVLEGDSLHQDIWTFPIGVTFSKDFALDSGWSFKPSLDFTVIPAAGDIKAKHDVHFTGLPGTYEVETQMMDYLTWQGGVGLELANDNMSIGVNYTLQAGQHTTGHGVFGSFRYEF